MKKLTDILNELKEESSVGGGTTTGATATSGAGEQYSTKKAFSKKKLKETIPPDFKKSPSVPNRKSKVIDYSKLFEKDLEELNENYARFRNQTKTRPKQEQFHHAVREVKKKMMEINRLAEYVNQLRSDLSEGDSPLQYKKHTESSLIQIKEMVAHLYKKIKSLN